MFLYLCERLVRFWRSQQKVVITKVLAGLGITDSIYVMNKSTQVVDVIGQGSVLLSFFWLHLGRREDPQFISVYWASWSSGLAF